MTQLQRFLAAMGGEWRVVRYELLDDDRVRVICQSVPDPGLEWGYCPLNPKMESLPKVGTLARICLLSVNDCQQLNLLPPKEEQP